MRELEAFSSSHHGTHRLGADALSLVDDETIYNSWFHLARRSLWGRADWLVCRLLPANTGETPCNLQGVSAAAAGF